ncbi:MBL fold metallo-hydrolase [Acrocarpospora sp. B8E8]|uniref:MBL fold metallo-hydrolase n=1 Tax=Acrocarpospora sp. B8E8 TaxID=3153572 RepID=UPI00325E074C
MTRAGVGEWTREGAYEVVPGIHRLPLPMRGDSLRAVNVYAIQDGAGVALVDAGWAIPEARQVLEKSLNSIGHTCADVTRVIVTHAHVDHYTLGVWLRAEHGTPVLVGRGERDSLEWLAGAGPRHRHQCELLRRAGAPHLTEHHRRRLEQSADAVARLGAATVAEVAAELPWTRHRRAFAELDDFNSTLAVFETSAHLAYLVAEGALLADEEQVPKYRVG